MAVSHHLLREARLRPGLTQTQLAERAGKAASAISRWERAGAQPSLETLRQLVKAAGFELTAVLAPSDEHDLTLIRRSLRQTPQARLAEMVQAVRALESMAAAAHA